MDNFSNKYSRQVLFWPDGKFSQESLSKKIVTIIGMGALGTALSNHLVRAGIAELRIVDRDIVEESNLQRQMLFDEKDARDHIPKVIAAKQKLNSINSAVKIIDFLEDVNATNIESIVTGSDLILDGTDNMKIRFLINDISIKLGIPWIYGGVVHSRGMTTTIIPNKTPCFRCLFPNAEAGHGDTCDTVGVLSTVVHVIASYQATEAFKLLIGDDYSLRHEMIQLDVWKNDFDEFPFQNSLNKACPCCQKRNFDFLESSTSSSLITSMCGRNSIQITPMNSFTKINFDDFYKKWEKIGEVKKTAYLLRLKYEEYDISIFKNGRLLVQGTSDITTAKRLYSTLVGE
ncbi:ThiF family adenylyltransferase [Anaerobacillus isosaccharinicus]|uniref:ThiF family adenylyltransferase n=1 Tax=Anaerobacillus isosaccharinicus TaxID=1532552 RepID=A0A1S2L989_9BACI|nr:ThiF family adenylyltransferase [Anaerobacillus isosaccharinicus]MBA5585712.1 ThiF family adenylyltransferase [Anaerobacillus isosaccharinicus]QOY35982.1 ThiF family adenylyltransferase [Anaerobacillus isosaccharinicus]